MTEEYPGKTFKPGNSVAVRLPKGIGIPEGTELRMVREAAMSFRAEPIEASRWTIDISGFAGKSTGFTPAPREGFAERAGAVAGRKALSGE